jgi:hypothetical protein
MVWGAKGIGGPPLSILWHFIDEGVNDITTCTCGLYLRGAIAIGEGFSRLGIL